LTDSTELLALRLVLLAILFFFVLSVALTMRSGITTGMPLAPRSVRQAAGPRLVVREAARSGLEPGVEFALAGTMTIGRDVDNGIVLADASVSGRHATIARTSVGWRVTDLGSTNGTLINGVGVDGRGAILHGGETLTLGSVVLAFYS
jgi:hypothetical protein